MQQTKHITPDRVVLLGAFLTALAYIPDVQYGFLLDDVPLILLNETISTWRNWRKLFVTHIFVEQGSSPFGVVPVHYRPIYRMWQMLNE